jgi:hypothetical protein
MAGASQRERESERERESACVCVGERERERRFNIASPIQLQSVRNIRVSICLERTLQFPNGASHTIVRDAV